MYKDFDFFRKQTKRLMDLESNEDKIKAVANSGGTEGILNEQGGELLMLKVVGGYTAMSRSTPRARSMRASKHSHMTW